MFHLKKLWERFSAENLIKTIHSFSQDTRGTRLRILVIVSKAYLNEVIKDQNLEQFATGPEID